MNWKRIRDPARQRRGDVGELEVQLVGLQGGLGRSQIGDRLALAGDQGVVVLLRDRVCAHELVAALTLGRGIGERRLLAQHLGVGLIDQRLIGPGIDDEKQLTLADDLAVPEGDPGQITADSRPDVDRIHGDELADIVVPVDDRLLQRMGDDDGRRGRGGGLLLTAT